MVAFPAAGAVQNAANTVPDQKTIFENWLAATKQLPGASAETELTIAAGVITPTGFQHRVDTEADAAADNLDQIALTNLPDGSEVRLVPENAARVATLRHLNGTGTPGTNGEMVLSNDENFALDHAGKWIRLRRKGSQWIEVVRSTVFGRRVGATADAAALRALGDIQQATGSLTENSAPALTDLFPMTVGGNHRKVQLQNVLNRITALTGLTAIAIDDEIFIYDLSATAAKKITPVELLKVLNALTADGAPDKANDYLLSYDASASTVKKVLMNLVGMSISAGTQLAKDPYATTSRTTQAHGLGAKPKAYVTKLVCKTAEGNFSIGDEVIVSHGYSYNNGAGGTLQIDADATNVNLNISTSVIQIQNKTTQAFFSITAANWKVTVDPFTW